MPRTIDAPPKGTVRAARHARGRGGETVIAAGARPRGGVTRPGAGAA